jgi:AraC-like DNA-binding protein
LADLWKLGSASGKYQCYSLVYALLSYVLNLDCLQYEYKKKFYLIDTAVDYLQKHLFGPDLKIDSLHKLSSVSDTYFRKIFGGRFGTSPKKYITEKRVCYAKAIIDSGEFVSVSELAEMVGYRDALYFGKVFKKHYGKSPVNSL